MPDPGAGLGVAWKAAKEVSKCDGNCSCPDCGSKKKQGDTKTKEPGG